MSVPEDVLVGSYGFRAVVIPLLVGLVAYPLCSSPRLAFPNTMPLAAKYWLTNGALEAGKKSTLGHYIAQYVH